MKNKFIILCLVIGTCVISGLVFFKINQSNNETVKQTLYNHRFITIQKGGFPANFDLKNKRYFTDDGDAATYRKPYGRHPYAYSKAESNSLLIDYLAVNTTHQEVRTHGYVLIYKTSPAKTLDTIGYSFSKIKIQYDHRYLPIRAYGFKPKQHKWYLYNRYSYQYHSEKQYNKDFNKMVKLIKEGVFDPD